MGNNTYLEYNDGKGSGYTPWVAVRLHRTNVVVFWQSGRVTLHTDGYRTVTTKDRINQFLPGGYVYQRNHEWFYHDGLTGMGRDKDISFQDGMNVA